MPPTFDAALLTGWTRAATPRWSGTAPRSTASTYSRSPDGDTGTNLVLTMRAATDSVRRVVRESGPARGVAVVAGALAKGALVGARGNSGVILSQVLRGVAEAVASVAGSAPAGAVLADALGRAHRFATAAVSRPREGTVLTVLAAAAGAARATGSDRLDDVAVAAADAAGAALQATTGSCRSWRGPGSSTPVAWGSTSCSTRSPALVSGRAGTVVMPAAGAPARLAVRGREVLVAEREGGSSAYDYEVMYLLDRTDAERVDALRAELDAAGRLRRRRR